MSYFAPVAGALSRELRQGQGQRIKVIREINLESQQVDQPNWTGTNIYSRQDAPLREDLLRTKFIRCITYARH